MQDLVLIGYFPKKVSRHPEGLKGVTAVRSASECISSGPDDWIEHWTHNDLGLYSTVAAARAIVPEPERSRYELHAYRMLPMQWDEGEATAVPMPPFAVEPLPEEFRPIGFDVVSFEADALGFGCSPLSCNYMANEITTNEHCLLDDLSTATRLAQECSQTSSGAEPGPYRVVEVLMRRSTRDRIASTAARVWLRMTRRL